MGVTPGSYVLFVGLATYNYTGGLLLLYLCTRHTLKEAQSGSNKSYDALSMVQFTIYENQPRDLEYDLVRVIVKLSRASSNCTPP